MPGPPADDSNSLFWSTTGLLVEFAFPDAFLRIIALETRNRDSSVPASSFHHLDNMEYKNVQIDCWNVMPLKTLYQYLPFLLQGRSPHSCRPSWPHPCQSCRHTNSPKSRPHSPPRSAQPRPDWLMTLSKFWLQSFAYLSPSPESETINNFLIVLVEASAGFPFHSTFSFTLALGDVQFVVVPRSFLDQRIKDLGRKHECIFLFCMRKKNFFGFK